MLSAGAQRRSRNIWVGVLLAAITGCTTLGPDRLPRADPDPGYDWNLPPGFPPPPVPDGNPMSTAKVELGRLLFYDTRLSGNQTTSCATCHQQQLAFTDGRARAVGSTGEVHPRSAMSLVNVAYNPTFNWADPGLTELEDQIEVPMFNRDPVELGLAGREREVEARLGADPDYSAGFAAAFPEARRPVSLTNVRKAIASFVRTLLSADSPWDRYAFWGETGALTPDAQRGRDLFFSDRTRCAECHRAPLFTGGIRVGGLRPAASDSDPGPRFHNTGLYDLDGLGGYPADNQGLFEHTGRAADMGKFKAPTLRNVELTAPYMHDGSVSTLDEVIDFYAAGGRGEGRDNRYKDPLVVGFEISDRDKKDLLEFLRSLTDRAVVVDPRFSVPQ